MLAVAIACAVLVGCGAQQWSNLTVAAGYQPPKRLNVTVLADSERDDWKEAVEKFTATLRQELKSKGIDATFGSAPPDGPLAELRITEWKVDRTRRELEWFVCSEISHMTIVVSVTNDDGASSLDGDVRGYVGRGGLFCGGFLFGLLIERDPLDAPRAAARSIADVIAKGKVEQVSPHSNGFSHAL